jgi:5-methylcytosine-specific restriction enzyme A
MPDAALRPCSADPRCPELSHGGPCASHRRARSQAVDRRRGTARQRGYSARWARYSRMFLATHPLCVRCEAEGRVTASQVTDHVVPHRGDAAKFWDPNNLAALCKPCHDRKTATEDGGFGRC